MPLARPPVLSFHLFRILGVEEQKLRDDRVGDKVVDLRFGSCEPKEEGKRKSVRERNRWPPFLFFFALDNLRLSSLS